MIIFYDNDILAGFLGQTIYILGIQLILREHITVIEQAAAQLQYWEIFRGVHNKNDLIFHCVEHLLFSGFQKVVVPNKN